MKVRIFHTADCHIGLRFSQYPDASDMLSDERFAALERAVDHGNTAKADFFVIAGDLFDSHDVLATDVRRTVDILKEFAGKAVIVVPGNHDYYDRDDPGLWRTFKEAAEAAPHIVLVEEPRILAYVIEDTNVRFYASPCPASAGAAPTMGWVRDQSARDGDALKIGIAHGNVSGLALDDHHNYFEMKVEELGEAGMATWLLGHIHVPHPNGTSGSGVDIPTFFMAGAHTPDSMRNPRVGTAWLIECDDRGVTRFEQRVTGAIRFVRVEETVAGEADLHNNVLGVVNGIATPEDTVLKVTVSGRLPKESRAELREALDRWRDSFMHVNADTAGIQDGVDRAEIERQYHEGSLAHRLLLELLDDPDYPEAASRAHELINEVRNA